LLGHGPDLGVDSPELPHREAGQRRAKQQQRAKTTIEPAANSEIEKRHWINPCKGSKSKSEIRKLS
jgi:hypothetical protein